MSESARPSRWHIAAFAAVVAALLLAAAPSVPRASAGDEMTGVADAKTPRGDHLQVSGSPVDDDLWRIAEWRDAHRALLEGWAGMVRMGDTVTVYWTREVPNEFRAFVNESDMETVSLAVSRYSYDEISAEIARLARLHPEVAMWSSAPDFSGVVATIGTSQKVPSFDGARVPVEVRRDNATWTNYASRADDFSPFYAGSQIFRVTPAGVPAVCSTGFPVRLSGGAVRMVTARHCGSNATFRSPEGFYSSWPSSRRAVGMSGGGFATTDSVLLAPIAPATYTSRAYTGGWLSDSSREIVGTFAPALGDGVCAGGAWSGQQCANLVTAVNVHTVEDGVLVGPGFLAINPTEAQAGEGDSGGPAVKLSTQAPALRIAGLLKGGSPSAPAPCQGWAGSPVRSCSRAILYVDVDAVLRRHDAVLLVAAP